jgi:phage gpG-like protein
MATIVQGAGGIVRLTLMVGDQRADVAVSRLGQFIRDWRPFWRDYAAPKFFADVQRNFETQGAYVGGWQPLSTRYAAWKAKHFPGKPILVRRGALKASLEQGGAGNVSRVTEKAAEFGTSIGYAKYHQGETPGKGIIPRRRILFVPTNASEGYGRLMQRYIRDQIELGAGSTGGGARTVSRFL